MGSVPTEILDIVHRLRELSEAGRLGWKQSSWGRGGQAMEIALASGHWQLTHNDQGIYVEVRDENGDLVFRSTVNDADPHHAEFKAVYDAAAQHHRKRIAETALRKMREELATR